MSNETPLEESPTLERFDEDGYIIEGFKPKAILMYSAKTGKIIPQEKIRIRKMPGRQAWKVYYP